LSYRCECLSSVATTEAIPPGGVQGADDVDVRGVEGLAGRREGGFRPVGAHHRRGRGGRVAALLMAKPPAGIAPVPAGPPSLLQLFLAFSKISLVSFGGGLTALLYRDFVLSRRWVAEADFMAGLALSQAMPGVNVTNLAIWLGSQLRGPRGAVVACLGALVPAALLIIAVGAALHELAKVPIGASALAGVAASPMAPMATEAAKATRIGPVFFLTINTLPISRFVRI